MAYIKTKNTEEYWKKRFSLSQLAKEKTAGELLTSMKSVYKNSLAEINKEIEAFYGRYAENNNLTLQEVNKRLNPNELKSAKYEIEKYYDNIDKLARNNEGTVDVSLLRKYKDELRLQSAKAYMSRLEEIKLRMKNVVVNLGIEESKDFTEELEKIYSNTYSRTSYRIDKGLGFSEGFVAPGNETLNKAIHEKWLGMNYSDRIWTNKGKLIDSLNTTFLQGVAQGHNPRKIAEEMSKKYQTNYHNCERLARTESIHIANDATCNSYKEHNITKYQFIADLSERTCPICGSLDNEVFDLKYRNEGVNYPVMHPNCRCTTVPYFEKDEIDSMFDKAQRVARDENGKLYYVPASMTYNQWREIENSFKGITIDNFNASQYRDKYQDKNITNDKNGVNYFLDTYMTEDLGKEMKLKSSEIEMKINKESAKGNQTVNKFRISGEGISSVYSDERQKLHQKIISEFLSEEKIKNALPKNGEKPMFVMLGGRGGSGKSWFTSKKGLYNPKKFIVIDTDAIKNYLPEYKGWNAGLVHEESSDLSKKIIEYSKQSGVNVIIDGTLSNPAKAVEQFEEFKKKGYTTSCDYMFLPMQESLKRACGRFRTEKGDYSGRFVPLEIMTGMTKNEDSFEAVKNIVDRYSFRDNLNVKGGQPRLIVKKGIY